MKRLPFLISAALWVAPAHAESLIRDGDHLAIVGNTFADQLRIHGYTETLLQQHADISLRNLGWAGDTLTKRDRPTNFPSEESTLTEQQTDVIIACFGLSESFAGKQGIPAFKDELKAFIAMHRAKKYNGETAPKLILVSPIAYEYHGVTTPDFEGRNAALASYSAAMKDTAEQEGAAFIDLYAPTRAMMDAAKDQKFTSNGIHLSPLGYWAVSRILSAHLIEGSAEPWKLTIDAQTKSGEASGVELSEIQQDGQKLTFSVRETSAASPPPPSGGETSSPCSHFRDTLAIQNLEPGQYTLSIEGTKTATANHTEWARGVIIDASPAHLETEEFRARVNDKNLQFLYNWKALNQVHIVGERRRSPSGKSLPEEQLKFNELAEQEESKLREVREPKKREWKLVFQGL